MTTHGRAFAAHDAGPSEYAGGIEVDLKVALAGLAAERVAGYPARKEDPDDGDGVTITSAVGALACLRSGLSIEETQSRRIAPGDPPHPLACEILERAFAEIVDLVRKRYPAVMRVAGVLQRQEQLSLTDLDRLIAGRQK